MRFPFDLNDPTMRIIFIIMALMCFFSFSRYLYLIVRSKKWFLIRAEISEFNHVNGSVNHMKPDRVKLRYQYVVNGKQYEGNKIGIRECAFPGIPGANFRARPSMIKKFKTKARSNREITVYYDPENPKVSCVDPSPEKSLLVFLFVCMVLLSYFAFFQEI